MQIGEGIKNSMFNSIDNKYILIYSTQWINNKHIAFCKYTNIMYKLLIATYQLP